jgi:hypothetical protein
VGLFFFHSKFKFNPGKINAILPLWNYSTW